MDTLRKQGWTNSKQEPSLLDAFLLWAKIGILSFGGPAAQIALMYREVVEEKKWLDEKQYLNALNFCMLLPGPEAMQLATYTGWRLYGLLGGLMAGLLFILPGAAIMLLLAVSYSVFRAEPFVNTVFLGIKAAVVIIVLDALLRLMKRALHTKDHWIIATLAFIGLFFLAIPYPIIIVAAALFGFLKPEVTNATKPGKVHLNHSLSKTFLTAIVGLGLWWIPLGIMSSFSEFSIVSDISLFFSKLAVVTFGGAYSVLSYMAQDVVNQYQWLSAAEMLDGLGLAETTPGPLILVTEFVGYLSAYHQGGLTLGLLGAAASLWATFAPCFVWIFVGAPYIDWISSQPRLQKALSAITAAVVGVILNLSIWFALHVFFDEVTSKQFGWLTLWQPQLSSINIITLVLAGLCALGLFKFKFGILRVLLLSATVGAAIKYIT